MSFRDRHDQIASAAEMQDMQGGTWDAESYDDPSEMPGSAIDALRITDHQCEANLLLINSGAEPLTPDELRLQSLAFAAGVTPSDFARDMLADRRRVAGQPEMATTIVLRIVRLEALRERFALKRNLVEVRDTETGESLTRAIDILDAQIVADKLVHQAKLDAFRDGLHGMDVVA